MQCEFYGPSQAKAEVKLAEWKKANARAISIIAQIIERPSTNSDACVIRVSTKTASNDSRPGRPEAAGRHRKKGAESERPRSYNFLVELGSFHSAFSSSPTAPMMLCPARSALLGRRGKAVGFTHRLAALLCVCAADVFIALPTSYGGSIAPAAWRFAAILRAFQRQTTVSG